MAATTTSTTTASVGPEKGKMKEKTTVNKKVKIQQEKRADIVDPNTGQSIYEIETPTKKGKRRRTDASSLDNVQWDEVVPDENIRNELSAEGFGGMMELTDYDIVDGQIVARPSAQSESKDGEEGVDIDTEPALSGKKNKKKKRNNQKLIDYTTSADDATADDTQTTTITPVKAAKKKRNKTKNSDNQPPTTTSTSTGEADQNVPKPNSTPTPAPTLTTTTTTTTNVPGDKKSKPKSRSQRRMELRKRKRDDPASVKESDTATTTKEKAKAAKKRALDAQTQPQPEALSSSDVIDMNSVATNDDDDNNKDKDKDKTKTTEPDVVPLSTTSKVGSKKRRELAQAKGNLPAKKRHEQPTASVAALTKPTKANTTHVVVEAGVGKKHKQDGGKKKTKENEGVAVETSSIDMSGWDGLGITDTVLQALSEQKFAAPTPIQAQTIPFALLHRKDIFASAETGSGKTLAFGLPIIVQLATSIVDGTHTPGLHAMIVAPTRELALQVTDHLKRASKYCGVKVAAIVGGLALPKQTRVLASNPEIIVATPGRLWELVSSGEPYFKELHLLKFLVIDEADRMVERGHFKELKQVLSYLTADTSSAPKTGRQTFIFSATLFNEKQETKDNKKTGKKQGQNTELEYIMKLCGLRDGFQKVVLADEKTLARGLTIARITCTMEEKDHHLYYFLTKYPGRTLVFVNSIDCIRRVLAIFKLVNVPVLALHASMQQRQRLKNLDRFIAGNESVLVATDVAARGLDIKGIEHVFHYQLPRDADTFVHRSGRTARASTKGLAVALVSPEEISNYKKIVYGLNSGKDLQPFPVERTFYTAIKKRLSLANQIDIIERKEKKESISTSWLEKSAREMDIELDDDMAAQLNSETDEDEIRQTKQKLKTMRAQLKVLLAQPLTQGTRSKLVIANSRMMQEKTMYKSGHGAALEVANHNR